jgi:protein-disulfide isomerase
MKKYLPTALVVLAVLGVVAFVVWALLRPDQSAEQAGKQLSAKETAELSQGQSLGKADSKVVLTEFGDYQCPACGQWHPFVKNTVLPKYQDRIKFVFKNLPLVNIHKNALVSAQAAEAAALQGKFWEMHNMLYETQSQWENNNSDQAKAKFESFARELGLDVDRWKRDFDSSQVRDTIKSDSALADKLQLPGTPSFLINGQIVDTKKGFEDLTNAIDKALAQSTQPSQ